MPEDVDYFECQELMNLDLHEEYQQVERVIGMVSSSPGGYQTCIEYENLWDYSTLPKDKLIKFYLYLVEN